MFRFFIVTIITFYISACSLLKKNAPATVGDILFDSIMPARAAVDADYTPELHAAEFTKAIEMHEFTLAAQMSGDSLRAKFGEIEALREAYYPEWTTTEYRLKREQNLNFGGVFSVSTLDSAVYTCRTIGKNGQLLLLQMIRSHEEYSAFKWRITKIQGYEIDFTNPYHPRTVAAKFLSALTAQNFKSATIYVTPETRVNLSILERFWYTEQREGDDMSEDDGAPRYGQVPDNLACTVTANRAIAYFPYQELMHSYPRSPLIDSLYLVKIDGRWYVDFRRK